MRPHPLANIGTLVACGAVLILAAGCGNNKTANPGDEPLGSECILNADCEIPGYVCLLGLCLPEGTDPAEIPDRRDDPDVIDDMPDLDEEDGWIFPDDTDDGNDEVPWEEPSDDPDNFDPDLIEVELEEGQCNPEARPSPTRVNFGAVPWGLTEIREITLYNDTSMADCKLRVIRVDARGGDTLGRQPEFMIPNPPQGVDIPPRGAIKFNVEYTPLCGSADEATLEIVTNDLRWPNQTVVVPMFSETKGFPAVVTVPEAELGIDFGAVEIRGGGGDVSSACASTAPGTGLRTVKVCNRMRANDDNHLLKIRSIELANRNDPSLSFERRADPNGAQRCEPGEFLVLAPDECAEMELRFSPRNALAITNELVIVSNDANGTAIGGGLYETRLAISGRGVAAAIEVDPYPISFGASLVGQEKLIPVKIKNTGLAPLCIDSMRLMPGASPAITLQPTGSFPITLQANQQQQVARVLCRPVTRGVGVALLQIISSADQAETVVIPIDCTGEGPDVRLYPTAFDFGLVRRGTEATKDIELCNQGNVDFTFEGIDFLGTVGGAFEYRDIAFTPPPRVSPGECIYFTAVFRPQDSLPSNTLLKVRSSALPDLAPIPLSGVGGEPNIRIVEKRSVGGGIPQDVEISQARLPDAEVGYTADGEIWIQNRGNMDLNLGEVGVTVDAETFVVRMEPTLKLAPGGEKRVVIRLSPSTPGQRFTQFYVCSDAANVSGLGGGACEAPDQRRYTIDVLGRGVDPKLGIEITNRLTTCTTDANCPAGRACRNRVCENSTSITRNTEGLYVVNFGTVLPFDRSCVDLRLHNEGASLGTTRISRLETLSFQPDFKIGRFVDERGTIVFRTVSELAAAQPPIVPLPFTLDPPSRPGQPADEESFSICYDAPELQGQSYSAIEIQHNVQGIFPATQFPTYRILLQAGSLPNILPKAYAKAYITPGPEADPTLRRGTLNFKAPLDTLFTLDGRASHDEDGTITSYTWTCVRGDQPCRFDEFAFEPPSGRTTNLAYARCKITGTYFLSLQVQDNLRAQSAPTAESQVTIQCQSCPTAVAYRYDTRTRRETDEREFDVPPNTEFTLSGALSSDADGTITRYRWELYRAGDETPMQTTEGADPRWTTTIGAVGTYDARLSVKDNDDVWSCNQARVRIYVGKNQKLKIDVSWDDPQARVGIHYLRPSWQAGSDGDCYQANPTPNWGSPSGTPPGHGNPRYQGAGQGATITHLDPGDGIYKLRLCYDYAPEDVEEKPNCVTVTSCQQCGCSFQIFICALCFGARTCQVCNGSTTIRTKRPVDVAVRFYVADDANFNVRPERVQITLNNQGRAGIDCQEIPIGRSSGEYAPFAGRRWMPGESPRIVPIRDWQPDGSGALIRADPAAWRQTDREAPRLLDDGDLPPAVMP